MSATGGVLWITGAGSGMGRAAAIAAAAGGWRVALSGRREDALEQTARLVTDSGGEALVVPLDVADATAVRTAHARIRASLGTVGGVVLSAGRNSPHRSWSDQSMSDFDAIVATNLTGVVRVIDVALPDLRESRGVVVVVSSFAGWTFSSGAGVAYSASKTALGSICRQLNQQEWRSGIRACHLCPGDVDTEFLSMRPEVPAPENRVGMLQPEDVARAVRFVLDAPPHVRIDELVISPVTIR